MLAQIPAEWEAAHDEFAKLTRAETQAGNNYRRAVDNAYRPLADTVVLLRGAEPLQALRNSITELQSQIESADPADLTGRLSELLTATDAIEGASDVRSGLSDARRALEGDNADRQAAAEGVAEAIAAADAELSWRTPAAEDLLPVLGAYDDGIRTNIGLRQLPRFPREQALYVASCNASHRDVSLNF